MWKHYDLKKTMHKHTVRVYATKWKLQAADAVKPHYNEETGTVTRPIGATFSTYLLVGFAAIS